VTRDDAHRTDRDQQILNRLARIEHRVDSIDQTAAFALRAESEKHRKSVEQIFRTSLRRAQVYLAANGVRSVGDIASYLGMKRQNVGTELKALGREGLLELAASDGARDVWAKKALDRSLRISLFLEDHFSLTADGKPKVRANGRRRRAARERKK
jgi:hypothetical protein